MGIGAHHDKETKKRLPQKKASQREKTKEYSLRKLCIIRNEIPSFKEKEEISIRQTPSGERRKGQENTKRRA